MSEFRIRKIVTQVEEILHEGGRRARTIAKETLREVRDLMGLPGISA